MTEFWAVAQTVSGAEHIVRRDIEEAGKGAFLPSYLVTYVRRGRKGETRRPLIPGYVFFQTSHDDWGCIGDIKGVFGVVRDADGNACRVHPMEMHRLMLTNASGEYNQISLQARQANEQSKRKRRRHRPSKRIRANTVPYSPRYANHPAL